MLRCRGVGGKIPLGSSSEASTWEAWLSKKTHALSSRRRGRGGRGGEGRCRRLSRRMVVVIKGHHTISRCRSSRLVSGSPRQRHRKPKFSRNLMSFTDQEIEEEKAHFAFVVAALKNYTAHSV